MADVSSDLIGQAKGLIPNISLAGIGNFMFWAAVFVVFLLIVGGAVGWWVYSYIQKKKFNKKIVLWQDVDGRPKIIARDKACESKIGTGGDTVFFLKKYKKIVPRYNIQTGDNTYWVYIKADGEFVNIGLEDIDLHMREAKVGWNDNELKYARASLQAINRDRFEKPQGFWAKYGNTIMNIIFTVIIGIMIVFVTGKLVELVGKIGEIMAKQDLVLDKWDLLLTKLDNVCASQTVVRVGA